MKDYTSIWETLGLEATLELNDTVELDLGKTIAGTPEDWRDTLRDSLPHLPVGPAASSHFKLESVLGRGGMGIVHLAHQSALGRDVAIKTIPDDVTSREAENALLQEARVMGLVEHPNVVPVHVIGQNDHGRPIIVMKRVDGTAWSDLVNGPIDSDDPLVFHLGVTVAICRALSFAHDRGIVHRDIKPENVMIGRFGEVYLLDWGLAVSTHTEIERIPSIHAANEVVGTPVFMAPEMTIGDGTKLGTHTDIFLLGASLYTVLTGTPPNQGKTLFEVMSFAFQGQPRPYPDDVPAELVRVCEYAMAYDAADRFESADAMREAIEAFLLHRNSYDLADEAEERLAALKTAITGEIEDADDVVHQLFGEARFGFVSALAIWAENEQALDGLTRCLETMIVYELDSEDVRSARLLYAELAQSNPDLEARIERVAAELANRGARLEKLAFDYDEDVGLQGRRWMIGVMAAFFATQPLIAAVIKGTPVPQSLRWITDDMFLLFANAVGLFFIPILLAYSLLSGGAYKAHKASRIFMRGFMWMYLVGFGARTTTLWGGTEIAHAGAAECAVYASGLWMLALAVDRRFGPPAVLFLAGSFSIVLYPQWTLELYSLAATLSCVSFLVFDYFRRDR